MLSIGNRTLIMWVPIRLLSTKFQKLFKNEIHRLIIYVPHLSKLMSPTEFTLQNLELRHSNFVIRIKIFNLWLSLSQALSEFIKLRAVSNKINIEYLYLLIVENSHHILRVSLMVILSQRQTILIFLPLRSQNSEVS